MPAPRGPSAGVCEDHTQSAGRQMNQPGPGSSGAAVHDDAGSAHNSSLVADTSRSLTQPTTATAPAGAEA